MSQIASSLVEKLETLSPEQLAEVESFVASLQADEHERAHNLAFARMSEASLHKVWDNPEDDVYNDL